jgi:hypothetical protein
VAVDVGDDHLLVDERVRLHQVRVARVVVDDELVDLGEPVRVPLGELLVLHAEPPMREARGEPAERRDLVQLVVRDELEDGAKRVEAEAPGRLQDRLLDFSKRFLRVPNWGLSRSHIPDFRFSILDSRFSTDSSYKLGNPTKFEVPKELGTSCDRSRRRLLQSRIENPES